MRIVIVVAVVIVVGAIGPMMKPALVPGSSDNSASINRAIEASTTLWPHEIHVNHQAIKEPPVHDVKEPF